MHTYMAYIHTYIHTCRTWHAFIHNGIMHTWHSYVHMPAYMHRWHTYMYTYMAYTHAYTYNIQGHKQSIWTYVHLFAQDRWICPSSCLLATVTGSLVCHRRFHHRDSRPECHFNVRSARIWMVWVQVQLQYIISIQYHQCGDRKTFDFETGLCQRLPDFIGAWS